MQRRFFRFVAPALLVLPLGGCGVLHTFSAWLQPSSEVFAGDVPQPLSVAWRDARGDVWLVPKRGVLIEQIRGGASWAPQGSYVVVRGSSGRVSLLVEGRWWDLAVAPG